MENKKDQSLSTNPNRQTSSMPENHTGFLPENNSRFFPNNNSVFLPENYSRFLPENHHPSSFPVFDPCSLNPNNDFDALLLAEYMDGLNLSTPRHQSVGPTESVLRSRAQSAARGQNSNFYNELYPEEFSFNNNYDDPFLYTNLYNNNNQNGFTGRPESVSSWNNSQVNVSLFEQPGRTGLFNRLNGQTGSVYRNNRVNGSVFDRPGSSQNQISPFIENMYTSYNNGLTGQIRVNGSRSWPNSNLDLIYTPNGSRRGPTQGRTRSTHAETDWAGSRPNHNGSGPAYAGQASRVNSGPGAEYGDHDLKNFMGNIKWMAKNRDGSVFLRRKIESGALEDFELIFEEVKDDVAGLMVNYFGNIVVQKMFKVCRPEQISYVLGLLLRVKFQFAEICCDNHGSLAMEKLLQNLTTRDQRCSVISALRGIVVNLSKDQNGLKVVQYCIIHFPENVDVLINEIADDCFGVATHKSGCVILQDCLGRAVGETMERLMSELGPNALLLSEHPYGNYVVQYILEKKNESITAMLLSWLAGNYVSLSLNKCSSNVVEKCLLFSREDQAAEIITEIMDSDNFKMVVQDPYGNYVVQKALDVSQKMRQSQLSERLESRIRSLYGSLNSHPFGNRVLSKLNHRPKPF